MSNYRHNRIPGGTYFFTVNLLERRKQLLVDYIDNLRTAIRKTRRKTPFHIDAWVILPDHMHCIWTLPECDDEYSNRWRAIKKIFQNQFQILSIDQKPELNEMNEESGKDGFGSIPFEMNWIINIIWITYILIPLSMGW